MSVENERKNAIARAYLRRIRREFKNLRGKMFYHKDGDRFSVGMEDDVDYTFENTFSNDRSLVDFDSMRKPNGKAESLWPEVFMQTFTKKVMKPLQLYQHDIDIRDIARSLSQQCRYTGQTDPFYSVATHSLIVASILPDDLQLEGLLHDASECYLHDLHGPLKPRMEGYLEAEEKACRVIASKFRLTYPWPEKVRKADSYVFRLECEYAMGGSLGKEAGIKDNEPLKQNVERQIKLAADRGMEFVEECFLEAFQLFSKGRGLHV